MKLIVSFGSIALIVFLFSSCKKNSENTDYTILAKWNIVTDSTFEGVGISNRPVNYTGQTDDYFDFRNDEKLYVKEGLKLDTLSYRLTSDTTILISAFGITSNGLTETSCITNLTSHHVTITASTITTPGGLFGRKVNLSR